jgi:hypothetical protein
MGLLLEDQTWGTVVDESFTTHLIEKIKNNSYSGASLSQDFDGDCDIKDSFDNFLMTTMNPLSDKYDPQGRE